jgi:WD40 repeat protein
VLAVALWLLPPRRVEWGQAMRAEYAHLASAAVRQRFAWGCLRVALGPGQILRLLRYALVMAAAVELVRFIGVTGAMRIELLGLGLLAPPTLLWLERAHPRLGVAGPGRAASFARGVLLGVVALCVAVAAVTIAVTMPAEGADDNGGAGKALGLALVVLLLTGYAAAGLSLTSAQTQLPTAGLVTVSVLGVMAGLGWCLLMPFNQTLSVPGPWVAAYAFALALVTIGAPAATGALTARRGGTQAQCVAAGAGASGLAALVALAGGWSTVRLLPDLLDTPLLDKGPSWRPPDIVEGVIPSYLLVLFLAPALGAAVGLLAHRAIAARPNVARVWTVRAGALLRLAVVGGLIYPGVNLFVGGDQTRFGGVGLTAAIFAPDGTTLLTQNADYTWVLWNIGDPAAPTRLATFNADAIYSPDGRYLASRNTLWSLADPAHLTRLGQFDGDEPTTFSPDGRTLFTHNHSNTMVWNVADPAHPLRLSTLPGAEGRLSPDGRILVIGDDTAKTAVWDVTDPTRPGLASTLDQLGWGFFAPTGRGYFANAFVDDQVTTSRWDLSDPGHPVLTEVFSSPGPDQSGVSPDGSLLALAHEDGSVTLWNETTATPVAILPDAPGAPRNSDRQVGASSVLTTVGFADQGHTLTVITGNSTASVWDVTDPVHPVRTQVLTRPTNGPGHVVLSPDGRTLVGAAADASNTVSLWRLR